jgi:hypothetical protein
MRPASAVATNFVPSKDEATSLQLRTDSCASHVAPKSEEVKIFPLDDAATSF